MLPYMAYKLAWELDNIKLFLGERDLIEMRASKMTLHSAEKEET